MPGVRSTEVPAAPFQLRSSISNPCRIQRGHLAGRELPMDGQPHVSPLGKPPRRPGHLLAMLPRPAGLIGGPVAVDLYLAHLPTPDARQPSFCAREGLPQLLPTRAVEHRLVEP